MAEGKARAGKGWWGRYGGTIALGLVALALLSGGLTFLLRSTGGEPVEVILPAASQPREWQVYISGAVAQPDVYPLREDVSLGGALQAAGGLAPDADPSRLQLHIPRPGEAKAEPLPTLPPQPAKININTASAAELEALPGIGPVLAGRIVAYREEHGPFSRIEDIVDVQGIGPKTFDNIKDFITVGPE